MRVLFNPLQLSLVKDHEETRGREDAEKSRSSSSPTRVPEIAENVASRLPGFIYHHTLEFEGSPPATPLPARFSDTDADAYRVPEDW